MLGAKKNSWNFLATETDARNYNYAKKNVEDNQLADKVKGTVKSFWRGFSFPLTKPRRADCRVVPLVEVWLGIYIHVVIG